ncbi:LPS-assembly protein LptD [Asticcacaulis sp. MM231]
MKRYSLYLGAGLVTLMTMGVGCGASAMAQASTADAADGKSITGTQLAFELAMAQAGAVTVASKASNDGRTETTPGTDGLAKGVSFIEADQIKRIDEEGLTEASGNVQMRLNGRTIRADTVTSNANTGVTIAKGHTQTINEDGSVQFADSITYDDNMESGYSENFALMAKNNTKVFARRLEQVNPDVNRLINVIYTPCQLCVKKGTTQSPTWSIEAGKITQRKDKKMVYYNNAVVKIHGVPVLYSPYLWTPDPELERASGFLPPKISTDRKRGLSYEQPYLWSISPYSYIILSPQLNASVNPLMNLEYKRQFYSGTFRARFGFTNESFFDNSGERHGLAATRDYLLADGAFKINEAWRWSFTAQHVKDPSGDARGDYANFFERYNIDGAFEKVGDLTVDSRQLINQINVTRQTPTAYFALTMANFQSMQVGGYLDADLTQPYAVSSDFYPTIAPQIEAYWSPKTRLLGGQLTLSANAIGIYHKRLSTDVYGLRAIDIGAPEASDGVTGYDTSRVSAGASWYGDMTTRGGLKWGPFFDFRHDYYKVTNLDANGLEGEVNRDLATTGLNLSYPLFKKFKGFTAIIEPTAQFAVSPDTKTNDYLPTEDSRSFEFDETTLFSVNKSPGFDIYESGARLNLGLRSELNFDTGLKLEGLVGRVLRDKPESQFLQTVTIASGAYAGTYVYDPTGLGSKNSDWIVDGSFNTGKGINGYTRLRLDGVSGRLSQGEYGLSMSSLNTLATLRYIVNNVLTVNQINNLAVPVVNGELQRFGDNYRNVQLYARHFVTSHWGVSARLDRDMVLDTWRRSTVSLIYRDDCSWFELVYQRNDTQLTAINGKPSSSIFFRLNLTTLGTSPVNFNDVR